MSRSSRKTFIAVQTGPQNRSHSVNPALQRADRAAGAFRHVFIGAFFNGDLVQKLPLIIRQPFDLGVEPVKVHFGVLLRCRRNICDLLDADKFAPYSHAADEVVDHDTMNPEAEVRAQVKTSSVRQWFCRHVPDQIISCGYVPRESKRPDPHLRQQAYEPTFKFLWRYAFHATPPV